MPTGYTRQSSADIVPGANVRATHLNAEFDAVKNAMDATTGHNHDGTVGGGAAIAIGSTTGTLPVNRGGTGATDAATARSNLGITNPPAASTATAGIVQLSDSTSTTSSVLAATPTAVKAAYDLAGTKLATTSGTATNTLLKNPRTTSTAVTASAGTFTLDLAQANHFITTIAATSTFAFSNVPANGNGTSIVLYVINGGAFTVTWPAAVKWAGGTAPTLTASGTDVVVITTLNGGTTWVGAVFAKDYK